MKEDVRVRGQLKLYLQWPLFLIILLVIGTCIVGTIDPGAGVAMVVFVGIYAVIALWLYTYGKKKLLSGMVEFSGEYANVQKQLLDDLSLPYALTDETGRILWGNKAFCQIVDVEKITKKTLQSLFPDVSKEAFQLQEGDFVLHTSYGERKYCMELKNAPFQEEGSVIAVYLIEETEVLKYKQEIDNQKMVAGLIYLDNYEEALESVEEVRRSLLIALIDRKIAKYIGAMDGIVKKMEKDKYFFTIKQQYVSKLQESRFSILEGVKTVNIGNEMAVTLSIGLGMNGESYSQNYEFARVSIDMALGRGGDQAVIKDGEKIQYYGGKSQQVEKTTRVKARVKAHALRELMETKDRLIIMGHKMSDIDAFGAAIGIYRIATSLNKKANIVINEVTTSVRPMMERFLDSDDYPEDLFLNSAQAIERMDSNTILVVVDVNRPSLTETPELLKMAKSVVVFDHHRQGSEIIDHAVLSYVEPYASSTCEMVAEILQYIADGIRIKSAEADAMYSGIVIDTNNFTNQTGVRTFEAAAFLRRNGADVIRVRKLFRETMQEHQAKADAIRQAEVFKGCFVISQCMAKGLESPTIIGAQVSNELLNISDIKASVVLTPYHDSIYLSARSIDEVNVQVMMELLGGGGHRNCAGAQLKDVTMEEAVKLVKKVLEQMLEEGDFS